MNRTDRNKTFLTNIFRQGPMEGHGFIAKPAAVPIHEHPLYDYTISDRPVSEWVPWVVENYQRAARLHEQIEDDGVPTAKLSTGTHLYAAAFGAPVHTYDDTNACALPIANNSAEADAISEPDIWKSPTLYRCFELGHAVQRELGDDVHLGTPDMQTGFDTAALLWEKSDFYASLMDPAASGSVQRLVDKCARTFKNFLIAFRNEFPNAVPLHCPGIWAPPTMGPWASNDECGAINTELFEHYCLPEMVELSEHFGGFGMHCCAAAEHQFESFKKIPNFYGFNRVKADQGYGSLLDHFDGPGNPVHVLAWITPDEIEALITESSPGTRFIFVEIGMAEDDAKRWLESMRVLSPRTDS